MTGKKTTNRIVQTLEIYDYINLAENTGLWLTKTKLYNIVKYLRTRIGIGCAEINKVEVVVIPPEPVDVGTTVDDWKKEWELRRVTVTLDTLNLRDLGAFRTALKEAHVIISLILKHNHRAILASASIDYQTTGGGHNGIQYPFTLELIDNDFDFLREYI